jgi:O-antigen/teichoic acid export membrane protein
VLWATGTVVTLLAHWPLWCIAMSVVASESLKTLVSAKLARRELGLRWSVKWAPVKVALLSSAPIFVSVAAHTIYNKLDVSFLAVVAGDKEVAWYTVSSQIAGLALIVTPMIGWVLLPLFAKARARSDAEYTQVMRRSLELVLAIAFPTSLFVGLGAEQWVVLMYGDTYAPAATSLKWLSSIFVLTYVAILSANALILTGRAWAQAAISISGLAVNPLLNWLLIRRALAYFGEGGAGIGAAMAQLGTELTVTGLMTALVGTRAFDKRSLVMIAKTIGVAIVVTLFDAWLQGRMPGLVRIAVDLVAYVALILAVRAIHLQETLDFTRAALSRRQKTGEPEALQRPA